MAPSAMIRTVLSASWERNRSTRPGTEAPDPGQLRRPGLFRSGAHNRSGGPSGKLPRSLEFRIDVTYHGRVPVANARARSSSRSGAHAGHLAQVDPALIVLAVTRLLERPGPGHRDRERCEYDARCGISGRRIQRTLLGPTSEELGR